MLRYLLICCLVPSLLGVILSTTAFAADKTHEGTVVSTQEGKLVMTDSSGKEHSHMIAASAKVTLDDKDAKLTDLKKGDKVKVSTDDSGKVTKIAATRDEKK